MNEIMIQPNQGFMAINSLEDAIKISEIIAKSSFCPKAFLGKPGDILVCVQFGAEVGLKILQSLQNIAVINGRPCLWGDSMLAVCQQSPSYEYIHETFDEATMTATCAAKRKGSPEVVRTFSKTQAEKAGLWGKNVWALYPERMLSARARGFALRDTWADTLRGIISAEEASDYPKTETVRPKQTVFDKMKEAKPVEVMEFISSDDLGILNDKVDAANADVIAICNHFKIESLDFVPKESVQKLFQQLDRKIEKLASENVPHGTIEPEVASFFEDAE